MIPGIGVVSDLRVKICHYTIVYFVLAMTALEQQIVLLGIQSVG